MNKGKGISMIKRVRIVMLIAGMLACNVGMAQSLNQIDDQGRKQGKWQKKYPRSVAMRYEGQFKDDKPVGEFKYYSPNGFLESVLRYKDDGTCDAVFYDEKGRVEGEGQYRDRLRTGQWLFYNNAGKVIAEEHFTNDTLDGPRITFFDNGDTMKVEYVDMGIRTGRAATFFENGQLQELMYYKYGQRHGAYARYYPDGTPLLTGEYDMGKNTGEWRAYNEDGTVYTITTYVDYREDQVKKMNGEFVVYYDDDQIKSVYHYKNGKRHGAFVEYYDNGEWVIVEKEDPLRKVTDAYRELQGQTKKREGEYRYGKRHGILIHYDEQGKVQLKEHYADGNLVE